MKLIITGILVFLIPFIGFSQDVDLRNETEVDAVIGQDNYYVRIIQPMKIVNSSTQDQKKMEVELKSTLAEKIISKVSIANTSRSVQLNINDSNDAKNNSSKEQINFEFNSNIKSDLTFSEAKIVFQEDNKKFNLIGLIYIDKAKFLEQNFGKNKY
jgi:preprotein translocase subunit SecF